MVIITNSSDYHHCNHLFHNHDHCHFIHIREYHLQLGGSVPPIWRGILEELALYVFPSSSKIDLEWLGLIGWGLTGDFEMIFDHSSNLEELILQIGGEFWRNSHYISF